MNKSNGRIWPYAIGMAITLVFGFCVATIFITESSRIQESDTYMTNYQDADAKGNELIHSRMLFDKKYNVSYIPQNIAIDKPLLKYKITDKNGVIVNNAVLNIHISRSETKKYNQDIQNPSIKDGVYTFSGVSFPKAGAWSIILKIKIGDNSRFYNIKVDTRNLNSYEF